MSQLDSKLSSAVGRPARRPGPSGDTDVRERILDMSEYLFATQGFSATSMRQIAERVDVTAAMIHYYFGNKKKLLQAVMERVLEPLAGGMASLAQRGETSVRDLTRLMFTMAADHPYLPQLITREVFLPGGTMQAEFLEHFAPRLGGRLPGFLQREQQAGRLAADIDAQLTAVLILSLCFFPFIARPAAEAVLGVRYDEDGLRALSEHIENLLERGLKS
jgi:AcrR family transcriptional regulator